MDQFWYVTSSNCEHEYKLKQSEILKIFNGCIATKNLIADLVNIIVGYSLVIQSISTGHGFVGAVGSQGSAGVRGYLKFQSIKTTKYITDLHNKVGDIGRSQRKKLLKQGIRLTKNSNR